MSETRKKSEKSPNAATPPRVFLFHGEDDYATAQKVRLWRESFAKKHASSGITVIDAGDSGWENQLRNALSFQGLFSQACLVVLKSAFSLPAEESANIPDLLRELPPETFVLFWETRPAKKNLRLYKKLATMEEQGLAGITYHALPAGPGLDRFINDYCKKRGYKISSQAVNKLAVFLGRDLHEKVRTSGGYKDKQVYDLWLVTSELDKLGIYKNGDVIEPDDVEQLVQSKVSENIFLLTDAVGTGSRVNIRKYLDQLLGSSVLPGGGDKAKALPVLGALAFQFRSLLELNEAKKQAGSAGDLASILGWSPYRVNANMRLLAHFPEGRLQEFLKKLSGVDKKIKTSSLPPKILLARVLGV
ncbi:MAG: hypothetical protein Q8N81_07855 [bacterium]|nr:hypothetical protein [bacterium]